ncbi:MAG: EF-P beta-lysylation protein EpmB [Neptuniibacter caesariensis]|uniref:L-lysine 2,3-aminomutase n=1 Tax=Neptuniibacter caesariensis TaxID=207954 RepID=A0A2G6JNJ4_NEPCE|nr:MAG: EF-P beta-lysylation protein EpmB [Neptuniibacter caesariensis]
MNSIPSAAIISDTQPWQQLLSHAIDDPAQLLSSLNLSPDLLQGAAAGSSLFALKVPAPFLERIEKGNPNDPLLKQILPLGAELQEVPGYVTDPLAEAESSPSGGLIHKYPGRVLLILSGACAINCRYCFRRHFPYQDNQLGRAQWQQVLDYVQHDPSISEVIFSGGDPLATSDKRLRKMIQDLELIPHLKRLRIHSRLPIVIPQRVTPELLDVLSASRLDTVMVLHVNHANELDKSTASAVARLKMAHITVLNQAVLLKGVNDNLKALQQLSETLFTQGILPYYLFTFDPVKGAAHFDIPDAEAIRLHQQLQATLPGYLVPKLAREIPGKSQKTLLF